MSTLQVLLFFVLPAFLVLVGVALDYGLQWRYDARSFHGDGAISDGGVWSLRPRFRIEFNPVALSSASVYVFRFSGVPNATFTLTLELNAESVAALDLRRTSLSCELADSGGVVRYGATSALDQWVLRKSPANDACAFWHPALRDVRLRSRKSYTLAIKVATDRDRYYAQSVKAVPVLKGGGSELP